MTETAVAIISWNTRDLLRNCLRSVLANRCNEVIVVDNGSADGSPEMVRSEFPAIRLVINPNNPGFGAAANRAFALTSAPYVLLLNADTALRPDGVSAIAAYLDHHPAVGLLGPRLVHPDGRLQSSCSNFPHPLLPLVKSKGLTRLVGRMPLVRGRFLDTWDHDKPRKVPWVVGAALAIRRRAFEAVDGFDERFHLYFEEPDLCRRMLLAGWETHFAPVTDVIHVEGASTQQRRAEALIAWAESYRYYNERHFDGPGLVVARSMYVFGMLLRWCREWVRFATTSNPQARTRHAVDAGIWAEAVGRLTSVEKSVEKTDGRSATRGP
jgi:GT2 family glycosyltransferase